MPAVSLDPSSTGGTLVSLDGRVLPLRRADLRAHARGGVARTVLTQRFVNPHAEPLRVSYQLPLPADGAVSGFRFRVDDREIVGEVDRRRRARERFEEALVQGHTAALVEQDRSSLFCQEVGNIPPGATVEVFIEVDHPLAWLSDAGHGHGGWEYRFPTVVAPRYQGAPGRVPDASRVAVQVADRPRSIEMSLELRIADSRSTSGVPRSPSHALSLTHEPTVSIVTLAEPDVAGLDRDVVVRWPVAAVEVGLHVDTAGAAEDQATAGETFGLVTVVPPQRPSAVVSRDLIVLIDTSGSMHGEPIAQAKRIVTALVDGLGPRDQLELIEFSTAPRAFDSKPQPATEPLRRRARRWIDGLRASGGTQMREGILAALAGVRPEAQRQIVLITDGQISFETEIIEQIVERLPAGSRVHTVGVGSAVNRSLTQAAARAGRGTEVILGIGEDPEPAAAAVLARTEAPLVVDLVLEGDALAEHAPAHLPDLFAGAPVLISARLKAGGTTLRVRGRTAEGPWQAEAVVPTTAAGQGNPGIIKRFGREAVEDLEVQCAAGADCGAIDAQIEQLGLRYQIATRLTSWIAVSTMADVDPGQATRRETVPQQLPHGMSIEGLGLRSVVDGRGSGGAPIPQSEITGSFALASVSAPEPLMHSDAEATGKGGFFARLGNIKSWLTGKPREASPELEARVAEKKAIAIAAADAKRVAKMAEGEATRAKDRDERATGAEAEVNLQKAEAGPTHGSAPEPQALPDIHEDFEGGITPLPGPAAVPGRIVMARDGRWVIEVALPFALSWDRPATVELCALDGTRRSVALETGTTAAAPLGPSVQLRLCFTLPAGADRPEALALMVDGVPLIIDPLR